MWARGLYHRCRHDLECLTALHGCGCSHDGGSLEGGHTIGDQVVCPRHGARFCLRTGAATKAPAYAPITVYPIKREQDQLWVDLNR